MLLPTGFWVLTTFLLGICIGSFLNVVIYRLPIGGSLLEPSRSFCPNCKAELQGIDLIPLVSFLMLGRKCRRCKQPISWRYFGVELLTGLLFVALYLRYPQDAANCVALLLFAAVLVPIFFIDLATFTIPDSLNLFAFAVPLARDAWGIVRHEAGHELLWGWLPRSIFGAVVGVLIFGVVRVLGWLWKRQEAMGLGDVLLARAMGAMLISVTPAAFFPLRLFPAWVLFSCFSGVLIGGPLLLSRKSEKEEIIETTDEAGEGRLAEGAEEDSLGAQLYAIGWCLWLGDLFQYIYCKRHPDQCASPEEMQADIEGFQPAPTAIPFGPYLVAGFLLTVFLGEPLTAWYLAYALPKPQ